MVLAAIVVAMRLGYRRAAARGLGRRRFLAALVVILVVTLAGGRLHCVLVRWHMFRVRPLAALAPSSSALHAPGAILGAVIGGAMTIRPLGLPVGPFIDALAPAAGIGIALARIGCFLHGCCFGTVCRYPWGVTFTGARSIVQLHINLGLLPHGATRPLPVHPLQLYFAGAALAISAFLFWFERRKRYEGQLGLLFLALFSGSTALLERFRAHLGPTVYWGPLPQLLWFAGAMTVASLTVLAVAEYRHRARRTSGRPRTSRPG